MVDRAIQRRNRSNKARGATFETDLVKYLRSKGFDATRQSRTGKRDEGDVSIDFADGSIVIEAKNVQRINLPDFLRQAAVEAQHFAENRGWPVDGDRTATPIVVVKRRNANIGEAYVVMTLDNYLATL